MTLIFSTQINSEQELAIFAEKILGIVGKGSILLLSGGLSSGKTTLVSNFCRIFGIDIIQSPTYSIHHRYANTKIIIDHYDLYRLESEDDIQSSGFFDLLNSVADYRFIEWPDRVKLRDYPAQTPLFMISITVEESNSRHIDIFKLN